MPTSNKKAQVTVSELKVNCAQRQTKPAKRAKKSKLSTNAESACPSFCRSLLNTDVPKEKQTSLDMPGSPDESVLSNSEGSGANVIRRTPAFEESLLHLFGPYTKAVTKPRRRWELDTHKALFGPDGQMMTSESPRHYDVFEPHRNHRTRPRKQQLDDAQNELFGDTTSSSRPASSTPAVVSNDMESSRQKLKVSRKLQNSFLTEYIYRLSSSAALVTVTLILIVSMK